MSLGLFGDDVGMMFENLWDEFGMISRCLWDHRCICTVVHMTWKLYIRICMVIVPWRLSLKSPCWCGHVASGTEHSMRRHRMHDNSVYSWHRWFDWFKSNDYWYLIDFKL